jgi:hypothetical protein
MYFGGPLERPEPQRDRRLADRRLLDEQQRPSRAGPLGGGGQAEQRGVGGGRRQVPANHHAVLHDLGLILQEFPSNKDQHLESVYFVAV